MNTFREIPFTVKYAAVMAITFFLALILTPIVKQLSKKVGAADNPDARRMNKTVMPSGGGLAIFVAFAFSALFLLPRIVGLADPAHPDFQYLTYVFPYVIAGAIIVGTGYIDDIKEIKPLAKVAGILVASLIIWFATDAHFDAFKIPFGGPYLYFPEWLSFFATLLWIMAITNAVNLIDGLDGLASGVSAISLTTMAIIAYLFLPDINVYLPITLFIIVAAIAGFFPYNFFPATIYLGDTGSLLLGFLISVFSLQGLKNSTFIAVITPLIILGVPITDTLMAIIRRKLNNQKIYSADKRHLHHRLLTLGLSHRATVLLIYGISVIFSIIAIYLQVSSLSGGIMLLIALVLGVELFVEMIGILGEDRTPLLHIIQYLGSKKYRESLKENKEHEDDSL
jgi:UDP-GlcNAc:undecaprenyl-phosphate GlcNAc-1-phosphate transferase